MVPLLLGGGERLLDGIGADLRGLELVPPTPISASRSLDRSAADRGSPIRILADDVAGFMDAVGLKWIRFLMLATGCLLVAMAESFRGESPPLKHLPAEA